MKRHLIIDGQIFQSIARHRGMGRYSEYLLNAIIKRDSYASVTVLLSKNNKGELSESDEDVLFKDVRVEHLDLQDSADRPLEAAEAHNKTKLDNYINKLDIKKSEIDFLLLAPFQEPLVSLFPSGVNKFLIFYDLIPYLFHEQYIHKMPFDKYLTHYKLLFEADRLLSISESVKSDICLYLGVPASKIEAIHGAAIRSEKRPIPIKDFDLPKKYVLMPTGDDPRKNNAKGVEGFELFNSRNNGEYKLIITSNIHYLEKANLRKLSNNIIFTGNIQEAELDWLYDKAEVVLFVSESEGLGLPILEAVGANCRVVCSSLDVFKEISEKAFFYCDQADGGSIADALHLAIGKKLSALQKSEYRTILEYYSWDATAKRAISAMQSYQPSLKVRRTKRKIAVFTPRPDGISAIGKVVSETHPALTDYFEVDYFFEEGPVGITTRPNYLQYVANYYPATNFSVASYEEYDAVFYHVGNSEYHLQSIANGLYLPGYVIIHDTNISDAYRVMTERGIISRERATLEKDITIAGGYSLSNHLASILTNQIGVITHSDYALEATREISDTIYAQKVNLPTNTPTIPASRSYKTLSFGLAGIIADIKGIEVIESLIKNKNYNKHDFLLFGYNYSSDSTIKRLDSYRNVTVATNVSDYDFVKKMKQLDVFVNYRMGYQGETSLSTLEAMRQGVVVIVRNVGWYSELPDDAVVKVETIQEVADKIDELVNNPDKLKQLSKRAVEYVRKYHSHDNYARGMEELIINSETKGDQSNLKVKDALKAGKIKTRTDLLKERQL